jgi:hypothetical protein
MKKILFVAVLAFASVMAYAQPRAIGGRLGAFNGVSYEHGFGDSNMLEIEAGFGFAGRTTRWVDGRPYRSYGHNIQAAVTYDWIDPFGAKFPEMPKGEWHWYMGVGGAAGYGWYGYGYLPEHGYIGGNGNWGFLGAAGRVGVEFDFWFPLQLSIDWRPTLGVGFLDNYDHGVNSGLYWEMTSLALGVRYKF